MNRRTLRGEASCASVGVHTGAWCEARLGPAPFGSGLVFRVGGVDVPAALAHASADGGYTALERAGARIVTAEHLLAALDALGVTDASIAVDGPEVPILDGSALGWVEAIDRAGRVDGPPVEPFVPAAARVEAHGGAASVGAGDTLAVEVDFGDLAGALTVPRTEAAFRAEIAWARTFVRASDVPRLQAAGRGRGASADNTVVWPDAPMRAADEPVRHKLLDLWGDLALWGPWSGAATAARGSHRLHLALARAAYAR
ncbi:MAG: UDP-3-O-acyl-N-acetylglucosamine deacetylase [Myxococcota bacterium]